MAAVGLQYAFGTQRWLAADPATTEYPIVCTDVATGDTFQPQALRFWWQGLGSASDQVTTATDSRRGGGVATSPTERACVATHEVAAAADSTCTTGQFTDCLAAVVSNTGPARTGALDLLSLNADGFTLVVDTQIPDDLVLVWEAIGGVDAAVVGGIAEPAAPGYVDYAAAGLTPSTAGDQVIFFFGCQQTALDTVSRGASGFCVGWTTGATAEQNIACATNALDAQATMITNGYIHQGDCLGMMENAAGTDNPNARATLAEFQTDGFQLQWIARGVTNRRYIFLAIKGGRWLAGGSILNWGAINNTTVVTGIPFPPIAVHQVARAGPEPPTGFGFNNDIQQLGTATSPTARVGMSTISGDGGASSSITMSLQYDQALPFSTTTLTLNEDISAFSKSGFTRIFDGTDTGGPVFAGYLAIGTSRKFVLH